MPPTVPAKAPEVRCAQNDDPVPPAAPKSHEWVTWLPPKPGARDGGSAVLSERAATWIVDVMNAFEKLRGVRHAEHKCLDDLEAKGLITQ